jgi:hypothetical protein
MFLSALKIVKCKSYKGKMGCEPFKAHDPCGKRDGCESNVLVALYERETMPVLGEMDGVAFTSDVELSVDCAGADVKIEIPIRYDESWYLTECAGFTNPLNDTIRQVRLLNLISGINKAILESPEECINVDWTNELFENKDVPI